MIPRVGHKFNMKKVFIVANWKSNKTILQTEEWFQAINNSPVTFYQEKKEVIVCSPFTLLPKVKELIVNCKLSIVVGAQNISPFGEGAYTGEVNGRQIKELADYVIVGHSERRTNFYENNNLIAQKIDKCFKNKLVPILCVSNLDQIQGSTFNVNKQEMLVTYEPLSAIGTGHPDTPENADSIALKIKKELRESSVLYGGSVTSKNVKDFTSMPNIDGVLVGGASLDPLEFLKIIKNA